MRPPLRPDPANTLDLRQLVPPATPKPRRRWSRRVLLTSAAVVILMGGLAVFLVHPQAPGVPEQLSTAQQTIGFPLYYPEHLPKGTTYQVDSVKTSAQLVVYTLKTDHNVALHISIEPKPKNVIFSDFYTRVLQNRTDLFSSQGKATLGTAGGQAVGSLVTDKVWVIINAPSTTDGSVMTQVVASLVPVH